MISNIKTKLYFKNGFLGSFYNAKVVENSPIIQRYSKILRQCGKGCTNQTHACRIYKNK